MAVSAIQNTGDGFLITGTTRIGRPVQISFDATATRFNVSVEPFEGSSMDEPFVEAELAYVMAEMDGLSARITQLLANHENDPQTVLLASVTALIDRTPMTPEQVDELLRDVPLGMSM